MQVVGVLGDVRNVNLAADPQPEIYMPFAQRPWNSMDLIARVRGDPHRFITAIRGAVLAIDHDQPVTAVKSMEEVLEAASARPRFTTWLLAALAGTAVLLALAGIYGVIAYSTAQRTQEVGIRVALGAAPENILVLILFQGLALAGTGIVIGIAAALALTQLLASMLYHVTPTDPLTFIAGTLLFLLVTLAASLFSARRAMRVDPAVALRCE